MLMGATPMAAPGAPLVPASAPAEQSNQPLADRTVTSEGAPPANVAVAAKLESTTPSAGPPAQISPAVRTQNELGDVPNAAAFPKADWAIEAVGAAGADPITGTSGGAAPVAAVLGSSGKVRPIGRVVALGIVTFGIYWLVALWGAFNDFKSIRQKNDVNPILFFIPILGLIELIKLPPKVEETRTSTGVVNPVAPNVVLYVLFPQIFFIADLNEIVQAAANRRSIA